MPGTAVRFARKETICLYKKKFSMQLVKLVVWGKQKDSFNENT